MPTPSRARTLVLRALFAFVLLAGGALAWLLIDGGRFLQREDPLQHADAIFVLAGTRVERPLEAVDLYKEGWAPVIVLSPGYPEPSQEILAARGVRLPSDVALIKNMMVQLGVPAAAILPGAEPVDNTAQEANMLRALVKHNGWHCVIVVTSKYHLRRAGFAFRRGLAGTKAVAIMRASRYDPSDPANWWRRRADVRFAGSEWVKLVLYWFGLAA